MTRIKKASFFMFFLFVLFLIIPQQNIFPIYFYHSLGYNIAKNESYVDTVRNEDIFWNPNSGFKLSLGLLKRFPNNFQLGLDTGLTLGYYKYPTTDGRKVNTEAQENNVPDTTNTEWSRILSLIPFVGAYFPFSILTLHFGIGAGPYFCRTYETWDFVNFNGQKAHLEIKKYYPVTLGFVGKLGVDVKLTKSVSLTLEGQFEAVNFVMTRVDLTSYTLDGQETIDNYSRTQVAYNYARDVPNENKGGDALLAGFNFANYPQEKIGTVLGLKIGVSYKF